MITPAQCLEARELLKWSRDLLAPQCGFSASTLANFEAGERNLPPGDCAALQQALEAAGVQFIEQNGGGPGVRMRDPL